MTGTLTQTRPEVSRLPVIGPAKDGWPWEADAIRPAFEPDLPVVSIVTPSYFQGDYLEETIRSVLLQDYPNIEYLVIDGGSQDASRKILRTYAPWLSYWVSEPDDGQAHAIVKGLRKASGRILAYLNSDDLYYPGAVRKAVFRLLESGADIFIGGVQTLEVSNGQVIMGRRLAPSEPPYLQRFPIFTNRVAGDFQFMQPAMFWTREIYERTGEFDTRLHYSMDREWCTRAVALDAQVAIDDSPMAQFSLHPGSKSQEESLAFLREKAAIYLRLSSRPEFRRVWCWAESAWNRFRYLQDRSAEVSVVRIAEGKRLRGYLWRTASRLFRKARVWLEWLGRRPTR